MTQLLEKLADDVRVIPQQLNLVSDSVLLVQLNDDELANHAFLDERIYRQDMPFQWVTWSDFAGVCEALPQAAPGYIFHIGHCGSTLLSRLVAAATGSLALREPLPLRALAVERAEGRAGLFDESTLKQRIGLLERCWTRGAAPVVVKATSICTNLVDAVSADSQVAFVFQAAETHLAVVLAGENAWQDLRGFGRNRYRRLADFDADLPPIADLGVGELAAMAWLAEISSASRAIQGRDALRVDFDHFLDEPTDGLTTLCEHFGLAATEAQVEQTVAGPVMQAYSKAPEHAYGPALRADVIADSKRRNAAEIERGLALIDRFRSTTCGEDWR